LSFNEKALNDLFEKKTKSININIVDTRKLKIAIFILLFLKYETK